MIKNYYVGVYIQLLITVIAIKATWIIQINLWHINLTPSFDDDCDGVVCVGN